MTVLVTGCRGRVGSTLLTLLYGKGIPVRAASSSPAHFAPPPGVDTVRCDLGAPETFRAALDGVDSVFLYADARHIDAFVTEARAAGVRHIVLLSSSAVLSPDAAANPVAAPHLAAERALAAASADGAFDVTCLQPGAFATNALQWAPAVRATGAVDLPYPDAVGDPLHEADLADVAYAALTDDRLRGSSLVLTGPEALTFAEQVRVLARAAGRGISVGRVTPEEWKASVEAYLPAEFADALLAYWRASAAAPVPLTRTVEEVTGRPARTFARWAADHAEAFRG
ncbi:NAD-dependent epimerase/dehydratase family protein [Streptomyces sp. WAC05374]|uniref:NAD(P)H-binding protein n=1 Tax=Streptomyces sp. WAC05374 TaxID=2487420 RepID=UPI000F89479D|nr:NAD(P)H-binding protein [Streptomyces sp. WAC05374]RST18253.1 NAD-dependent epimerase/dehydratase family protein [Streptomyces sp. WAC05374]TDF40418.1 NAD-dependent epimerase/dehydratase family protein [Streptomyces sp. WAC05374]TDF49052.1 NAD-dependent epimerase/dehydratase family protein [Streptomyces sp. WAC05374]TDF49537.1 NAD-dependent epimerase/dehydratase family protein [Streptomyces sp. WAC05374]